MGARGITATAAALRLWPALCLRHTQKGRTLLRESPPVLQRNKIVLPKRFLIIKATRCRGSSFTKSPCLRSTLRFHVRASIVLLRVERRAAEWRLMPRRFRTPFHYFFSKSCSSVSLFLLSMLSSLLRPACCPASLWMAFSSSASFFLASSWSASSLASLLSVGYWMRVW